MGMSVVGLGLTGLALTLLVLLKVFGADVAVLQSVILPIVTGFSMGASSIALFARVGGGIIPRRPMSARIWSARWKQASRG